MGDKSSTSAPFSGTGPAGHRGRMRTRLLANETALADYEILEMLLFLGIERRDTKPLAKALINRFGSLPATLAAPPAALATAGLTPRAIEALALIPDAAHHLARPETAPRPTLDTWTALLLHLDPPARAHQPPGLSALLLNNRNQLLAEPTCPPQTRDILRQALDRHATALILVRNAGHTPPTITPADRALHADLKQAGAPLAITVHDLVVVSAGECRSLRQSGPP